MSTTSDTNVEIAGCQSESGFNGPGVRINGNFECHNNSGACDATLGQVGGDLAVHNNTSSSSANISLTEVQGNLDCVQNTPAPAAPWGGNWVAGQMRNQCAANLGFAWPPRPPGCDQLAGWLSKIPYIATATQSPPPSSSIVVGTSSHASYCGVLFTYSAIGSIGSLAPTQNQSIAYGYGGNSTNVTSSSSPTSTENQAIKVGVGLPLSNADMPNCSSNCGAPAVQGAWNGKLQNLGGGGLVGNVGSPTAATDVGYVGTSTDTGHSWYRLVGDRNGDLERHPLGADPRPR